MPKIRVQFTYEPEPCDADEGDATGLTEEAFMELNDELAALGAIDVEIEAIQAEE